MGIMFLWLYVYSISENFNPPCCLSLTILSRHRIEGKIWDKMTLCGMWISTLGRIIISRIGPLGLSLKAISNCSRSCYKTNKIYLVLMLDITQFSISRSVQLLNFSHSIFVVLSASTFFNYAALAKLYLATSEMYTQYSMYCPIHKHICIQYKFSL